MRREKKQKFQEEEEEKKIVSLVALFGVKYSQGEREKYIYIEGSEWDFVIRKIV